MKFNISSDTATMYNTFKVLRSDLTNDGEMNTNTIKENNKKKETHKNDAETAPDQTSQDDSLVLFNNRMDKHSKKYNDNKQL